MLQCYQRKQVRECRAEAVAGRCSHLAQSVRDGERERGGGKERLDPHVYRLLSQRLVFGLLVQRPLRFPTNPKKRFSGRGKNLSCLTNLMTVKRPSVQSLAEQSDILGCRGTKFSTRTAADKEPEHLGGSVHNWHNAWR